MKYLARFWIKYKLLFYVQAQQRSAFFKEIQISKFETLFMKKVIDSIIYEQLYRL